MSSTAVDLRAGDLEVVGELLDASNYSLLARIAGPVESSGRLTVYKPRKGETPLWDFPNGTLCQREVAASVVGRTAGWDYVPPTVLREGPYGVGAVQLFIDHDPNITAFDLLESHVQDLMNIAAFDIVINNADRKAGHVFLDESGRLRAVDHGVCFHVDAKLRTVLWDFVGGPLPPSAVKGLEQIGKALGSGLRDELSDLLSVREVEAFRSRVLVLQSDPVFPPPGPGRPYPWPPV